MIFDHVEKYADERKAYLDGDPITLNRKTS